MKVNIPSKIEDHQIVARNSPEHRSCALEAAREAAQVLSIFENENPNDDRPRQAIDAIRAWACGKRELGMAEVRTLSLNSHAAAREAKTDAARFAARAAGHAVATWHVPEHAGVVPKYVAKAIELTKR